MDRGRTTAWRGIDLIPKWIYLFLNDERRAGKKTTRISLRLEFFTVSHDQGEIPRSVKLPANKHPDRSLIPRGDEAETLVAYASRRPSVPTFVFIKPFPVSPWYPTDQGIRLPFEPLVDESFARRDRFGGISRRRSNNFAIQAETTWLVFSVHHLASVHWTSIIN